MEAYRAYLVAIAGQPETSPEVLKSDKQIKKYASAISVLSTAENLTESFDEGVAEYRNLISNPSVLIVDKAKYGMASHQYESLRRLCESIEKSYSQVAADFPSDRVSPARNNDVRSAFRRLPSPDTVLKNELCRNPSETNIDNYIAFSGVTAKNAKVLRSDFSAWKKCKNGGIADCDEYLDDTSKKLFREEVQRRREKLLNEGYVEFDENLWSNTDKNSKQSLMSYLAAENNGVKNHGQEAERLIAGIEAYEKARETEASGYASVDKSSAESIRSYLRSHPETVYSKELYRDLDEVIWASTDKTDKRSLEKYLNSRELETRQHKLGAWGYLAVINGRRLSSEKNWSKALKEFQNAEHWSKYSGEEVFTARDIKLYDKAKSKTAKEAAKAKSKTAKEAAKATSKTAKAEYRAVAGYPVQILVGGRLDVCIPDKNLDLAYLDKYGTEKKFQGCMGYVLDVGLKFGRNDRLVNFEAGCDFGYYGYGETIHDGETLSIPGLKEFEIYPNGQLKFNFCRNAGFALTAGVGGGYRVSSGLPCVQTSFGVAGSKVYNIYAMAIVPVMSPVHWCLGLGFNIYFL